MMTGRVCLRLPVVMVSPTLLWFGDDCVGDVNGKSSSNPASFLTGSLRLAAFPQSYDVAS